MAKDDALKELLEKEVLKRDSSFELSSERPDPLLVAKAYNDPDIALVCALFGYGNAHLIVRFLQGLDFSLLKSSEERIKVGLRGKYYRFQKEEDTIALFIALRRLKNESSLETLFLKGYQKRQNILDGIDSIIQKIEKIYPYESRGYRFLLSRAPSQGTTSPFKRWNMYLRWMVRKDRLDLGLWSGVKRSDLLIPLDTHTFNVSRKLGLLKRKSYDIKAVKELTLKLKEFDPNDPVKYDFALYRLGQEGVLAMLK